MLLEIPNRCLPGIIGKKMNKGGRCLEKLNALLWWAFQPTPPNNGGQYTLGVGEEAGFFWGCFQCIPTKFSLCSHQVPYVFPNIFPTTPHFVPYDLPNSFSWNLYRWASDLYVYIFGMNVSICWKVSKVLEFFCNGHSTKRGSLDDVNKRLVAKRINLFRD